MHAESQTIFRWHRLSFLGFALGGALCGWSTTTVFRDAQVLLPVFVAENADPAELAAAKELRRVLTLMSGLPWPTQIFKGDSRIPGFYLGHLSRSDMVHEASFLKADPFSARSVDKVGPDGFRIFARAGRIFIEGATAEATEYAVAWLLQKEGGVRWYAPGDAGEIIPRREEWTLPDLEVICEPAYASRELTGLTTAEEKQWARRNGLNSRFEFSHALDRVFLAEDFAKHPEWRSTMASSTVGAAEGWNSTEPWQPNFTSTGVANHAAAEAMEAFAAEPGRLSFSLGLNDNVRFDQSEETRALVEPVRYFRGRPDYSPLVFTFLNRVAASVTTEFPDRYVGCLAYFWCERPPAFQVNRQILPVITTDRSQYFDSNYRRSDFALMSDWAATGVTTFGLWEYAYGRGYLVPRVPLTAISDAIREGWHRGARVYLAEINPNWGFDTFKTWALAQLLWDPARSMEELAADFFPGYYGPASSTMQDFFARCESQWMQQSGEPYWLKYYFQADQALLFPEAICRELRALINAAEQAVSGDPPRLERVRLTSRAFAVTEAFQTFDAKRRELAAIGAEDSLGPELRLAHLIGELVKAKTRLTAALEFAQAGSFPAFTVWNWSDLVRNDPVTRLLWLAGRGDSAAPRRILQAAHVELGTHPKWSALADAIAARKIAVAPNRLRNSSFSRVAEKPMQPRFLYPNWELMPAGWQVSAMPTENGKFALIEPADGAGSRAVRMEAAWDTQLFQWIPAEPDCVYVATARLRGRVSAGNDSGMFLTFLDASGGLLGTAAMQAMPTGLNCDWRTSVLAADVPDEAAWVGVGVGCTRQSSADWMEATKIELRAVIKTPSR